MANPRRLWTDYPPHYAVLAKSVATAALPALYGPFPRGDAFAFRRNFYRFREALRVSLTTRDSSYPARLYEMIETLSVKIESSNDDQSLYNVIFDLDPVVAEADKIDPAAAQQRVLARAHFAAAQRPATISSPIFSDKEMRERLDDMES
jgi:hypothetical protein